MSWLWKKVLAGDQASPALLDTGKGSPVTAKRSKMSNIMKPINNAREKQNNRRSLVVAVIKKDITEARRLLDTGIDANTTDGWGTPILMLVPRVIANASINTRKRTDKDAIQVKCIEMLNLLLEKGADINKQDAYGLTTLYSIVVDTYIRKADKLEYINILLNKGANLRIPCKSGSTLMDYLFLPSEYDAYINKYIDENGSNVSRNVKELMSNPNISPRDRREAYEALEKEVISKMEAAQRDTPDPDIKGLQIFNCWRDSDRISLQGAIHRSPLTKAQMTRTGNNAAVRPRRGNAAEANIARIEAFGQQVKGYQNEVNAEYEAGQTNVNAAEGYFEKEKAKAFPENPEVAKRIQNFQKEAAAELAAAPAAGGRRRNKKTKKHMRKHSYRK